MWGVRACNLSSRTPSYLYTNRRFVSNMPTVINKTAHAFDKARLESLLGSRFFYAPAFEIYGGTAMPHRTDEHRADRTV